MNYELRVLLIKYSFCCCFWIASFLAMTLTCIVIASLRNNPEIILNHVLYTKLTIPNHEFLKTKHVLKS